MYSCGLCRTMKPCNTPDDCHEPQKQQLNNSTVLDVSCGIIRSESGDVLVMQRAAGMDQEHKWEFPGGKLKKGETAEDSLLREIQEELQIDIVLLDELEAVEHDYGAKQVRLHPFVCDTLAAKPALIDHQAYQWLSVEELDTPDWAGADVAVVHQYRQWLKGESTGYFSAEPEVEVDHRRVLTEEVTRKSTEEILDSLGGGDETIAELVKLSLADADEQVQFRASWSLTKYAAENTSLLEPYLEQLILALENTQNHSVIRSFLKILQYYDLNKLDKKLQGILINRTFEYLNDTKAPYAIHAYSMEVIYMLIDSYPELKEELRGFILQITAGGAPSMLAKARKLLPKL